MVRKKLSVRAKGGCLCGDKGGGGSVIGFLVKHMQTGTAQCQSRWHRKRRKACACEPSTWKKGESLNNKWSRRSARWFCNNKEDDHFSVRSVLELGLTIEDGSPFSRLSQSIAFDAFWQHNTLLSLVRRWLWWISFHLLFMVTYYRSEPLGLLKKRDSEDSVHRFPLHRSAANMQTT